MFASVRLEKIRELITEIKKIEISSLVTILQVSEATIRRDLEKLEQEGFLHRTHGGAVLVEPKDPDPAPEIDSYEEKVLAGYIAAQLVRDGQSIVIGGGTTCLQMCKHLGQKRDLTVVTNNIEAALILGKETDANVVLTGGALSTRREVNTLMGEFATSMLKNVFVDIAFLGVGGVDISHGYSSESMESGIIWKQMRKIASETVVVCDHTKFGRKSLVALGALESVSRVVTDKNVPDEYREFYFSKGIPLYTSYALDSHQVVV